MSEINKIASKYLGQSNNYVFEYDRTLLVKIPRLINRNEYGITETDLPFCGYDVWNAYELSALTMNGLPVNVVAKIVVPCESKCIIESKSLKLYLNSFNLTKLGNSSQECISELKRIIKKDLESLLEIEISISLHQSLYEPEKINFSDFPKLNELVDLDSIKFDQPDSSKEILEIAEIHKTTKIITLQSDLLRSNCRVTNQPDWGDIFIYLKCKYIPNYASIAKYIVSHRKINHFHEEVAEMFFMHFFEKYQPEELMIACLYTRRGGIDINPVRATSQQLIPPALINKSLNIKTLRQ